MGLRERYPAKKRTEGRLELETHKFTRRVFDKRLSNFFNRMRARGWKLEAESIGQEAGVTYHYGHWLKFRVVADDEPHRRKDSP